MTGCHDQAKFWAPNPLSDGRDEEAPAARADMGATGGGSWRWITPRRIKEVSLWRSQQTAAAVTAPAHLVRARSLVYGVGV